MNFKVSGMVSGNFRFLEVILKTAPDCRLIIETYTRISRRLCNKISPQLKVYISSLSISRCLQLSKVTPFQADLVSTQLYDSVVLEISPPA